MRGYLIVGGTAAVVTFLATYLMRWLAPRIGAMAMPGARSVHAEPTPSMGGAGMFLGLLAAMLVGSRLEQFQEMFSGSSEPLGILLAAGVMFAVGAVDDVREVSPPAKIAGQVLSGSLLSMFGVTMLYFRVPFASYEYIVLSPDLASLLTVIGVVILANAMNLIDGLDGLAAGISLIAGAALFLYADRLFKAGLLEGSNIGPLVAIIVVGISAGFLPHNVNPARIFMGDAGSMLLGLMLAVTTITVGGRTADQFSGQTYFFFAPLVIPILILGVPIADTAFSFIRRLVRRQSFSTADREHLHHRLMRLGHGPRRSVAILWLWTALLSAAALVPTYTNRGNSLVPIALGALALLLYSYFHPGVVETRRAAREDDPTEQRTVGEEDAEGPSAEVVDLESRRRAAGDG
ncbi:MAG: undecaprenyl/decaprenyl-phosphate alpha-N-acetylglucosaminyl 1-phosphate transferase [Actinobacteria bacterium]|nr:undecaprenyl/decaprenyl-phosphate alpha-N-acetylglucosaminyl 1-phosphate transferase [Actinomycetota bacterium]